MEASNPQKFYQEIEKLAAAQVANIRFVIDKIKNEELEKVYRT